MRAPRTAALLVLVVGAGAGCQRGVEPGPHSEERGVKPDSPTGAWPATDDGVLEQIAATLGFTLGEPAGVWIAPDGETVLFRRSAARSFESDLYSLDLPTGKTRVLLRASQLLGGEAEDLSPEEKARRERKRLATRGITSFTASDDGARLLVPLSGRLFLVERATGKSRELTVPGTASDPRLSPDGTVVSVVIDGDVHAVDAASGQVRRLTRRTSPAIEHGLAEFVAQEEMGRFRGTWWSPDSRYLAYQRTDASAVDVLHVADATRPDQEPTAFRYPRPGRPNADVTLGIVPAAGGETVWVKWDRAAFPYLATVEWPERAPLTIVVQDRAQSEERVLTVDPRTGETRQLLAERDDAWLNLDQSVPRWLPDGSGFLWSTERSGAWELELRAPDGELVRTVVPGALGYRSLSGVSPDGRAVWVVASDDPRQAHVYRVPIDGGAPERITRVDGWHDVVTADQADTVVVVQRGADGARSQVVRGGDGSTRGVLESVAERPARMPVAEQVTVEVDGRQHRAAILKPRDFEAGRRYPVLLSVYGGPHKSVVTLEPYGLLTDQWYADGGFVVVRSDNRGTPGRGRAWERAIRGDLVGVAMDDQVAVLKELARTRPEMDLGRVGITGWSFGGYMAAMGVLLRPDVFRAAVAGAPVTDWRDYDTHYTERYMGLLPAAKADYDRTSALTHAASLERPLLLVHGTTDDNVYFTHSLKLSQALFRAGRPFEMLPLAGFTHMVPDPAVKKALHGRILAFFRDRL